MGESIHDEPYARSLRSIIPALITVVVVFDTDPPVGTSTIREVGGVTMVHARAHGGDDAIVGRVRADPDATLVVSDDIELRERVTALGASAVRNDWLRQRLDPGRPLSPSIGRGARAVASGPSRSDDPGAVEPGPWKPGRGATTKRGPGKRPRKRRPV